MRIISVLILTLATMGTITPAASAHALQDVEAPSFELSDADGHTVALSGFHGKVVVLNFIYTNCPDVCPLQTERIAEIQRLVNRTPMRDQVQFVTITTDPKRDTLEMLRSYGSIHGLDPVNWILLTAGPDQAEDSTRQLAEAYGVKFIKADAGYQRHAVVTHVIDREGRLHARFYGLELDPVNFTLIVNALASTVRKPHAHGEQSFRDKLKDLFR